MTVAQSTSGTVGEVAELWRFPVKSLLGESLPAAEVTSRGVVGDRAYAVVDESDGKVASAKNPRKWSRLLELSASFVEPPVADGPPPPVAITFPDGTVRRSDDGADAALSTFLGRPVRLASTAAAPEQRTLEEVWPDIDGLAPTEFIAATRIGTEDGEAVSDITMALAAPPGTFFDLSVLHLVTTATLDALRALEPEGDFDVRRYRPNVVVRTAGAGFVENDWVARRVVLGDGGAVASVSMPTMRCVMTTLAQPGGLPRDRRLLSTIARHNRIEISGLGRWACAGVYADAAAPGTVSVGDTVGLD